MNDHFFTPGVILTVTLAALIVNLAIGWSIWRKLKKRFDAAVVAQERRELLVRKRRFVRFISWAAVAIIALGAVAYSRDIFNSLPDEPEADYVIPNNGDPALMMSVVVHATDYSDLASPYTRSFQIKFNHSVNGIGIVIWEDPTADIDSASSFFYSEFVPKNFLNGENAYVTDPRNWKERRLIKGHRYGWRVKGCKIDLSGCVSEVGEFVAD